MRFYDPFRELESLRREIERAFDTATLPRPLRTAFSTRTWPLLNIGEDAEAVHVEVLLPGVDPASLQVTLHGRMLTVSGEKPASITGENEETWHRAERTSGRFVRSVTLPADGDADHVKADYRNGLLNITIPKTAEARPRQIAVSCN